MVRIKKIKAYSIVESAIAMSVITACLGIGSLVFSNVIQNSKNFSDHYLENDVDSILTATVDHELYINESIETNNGIIEKTIEINENSGLMTIKLSGSSKSGKKIEKNLLLYHRN